MEVEEGTSVVMGRHTGWHGWQQLICQQEKAPIGRMGTGDGKGNHLSVGNYTKPGGLWTS